MDEITKKFQQIYSSLKQEKGDFYVFMILKVDEYIDKWSIVVSAPWITKANQGESFNLIVGKIKENLTIEESSTIARLGIFQPDEHFIKLVNESISVDTNTPVKLAGTKLNGYFVHEAYVFESKSPVLVDM